MDEHRHDEPEATGTRAGLLLLGVAVVLLGLRLVSAPDGPGSAGAAVAAVLAIVAAASLLHVAAARHPRRQALFGAAWIVTLVALLSSLSLVCGAGDG